MKKPDRGPNQTAHIPGYLTLDVTLEIRSVPLVRVWPTAVLPQPNTQRALRPPFLWSVWPATQVGWQPRACREDGSCKDGSHEDDSDEWLAG